MSATRTTQLAIAIAAIIAGAQQSTALAQSGSALTVQHAGDSQPVVRSAKRASVDSERFSAGPNETFELLLADGTSITLAAGAEITVDRYRYDPAARLGELNLTVTRGAVRIIGGALNNTSAITVDHPGGRSTLDNAIAVLAVDDTGTDVELLLGKSLTVNAASATRVLDRPGSVRVTAGDSSELTQGSSAAREKLALAFNPGLGSGIVPVFITEQPAGDETSTAAQVADASAAAKEEALVLTPQGQVAGIVPSGCAGCDVSSGFELSGAVGSPGTAGSEGGSTAGQWVRTLTQDQTIGDPAPIATRVDYEGAADGLRNTTNRTYGVRGYSQILGDSACAANPLACAPAVETGADGGYLRFAFGTAALFRDLLDAPDDPASIDLASTLWLSDHAFDPGDRNGSVIDFVTTPRMGGNIVAGYTFDAPGLLGAGQDGSVQSLSATGTRLDDDRNLLSDTGEGSYALLQAGLRRADVSRDLIATYSPRDATLNMFDTTVAWAGSFAMDDEARGVLCGGGQNCPGLAAAFDNRGSNESGENLADGLASSLITDRIQPRVGDDGAGNLSMSAGTHPEVTCTNSGLDLVCGRGMVANLVYTLPDHFLLIEARPPAPAAPDLQDTRQFLFATGAVSGRAGQSASFTVDRFFLSAGLEGYPSSAPTMAGTAAGARAFFLPDAALDTGQLGLTLVDAGAYVINPAIATTDVPSSRLFHTDFGTASSSASCSSGQCSTISLTLGTLDYSQGGAQFDGYTIGSTRTGASTNSIAFHSGLTSTALGGGNPALACTNALVGCSAGANTSGRAGYLVLENYTPEDWQLTGGTIHSIGAAATDDQRYALLRLATATGALDVETLDRTPLAAGATGFIAGLVESDSLSNGGLGLAAISNTSAFQLSTEAAAATVSGSVDLSVASISGSAADAQSATLSIGEAGNQHSAYLDRNRFAAMATTQSGAAPSSAFVSGAAALNIGGDTPNSANAALPDNWSPPTPQYMQWGFFFGDIATSSATDAQQWHAHLVPWVRGTLSDTQAPLPSTATATYTGFAIGNVAAQGQLYTAYGTYRNEWNFATRLGNGRLDLDGARYAIRTELDSNANTRFTGALLAPIAPGGNENAVASSTPAVGSLNGGFVTGGADAYSGVMGSFAIGAHRSSASALPTPASAAAPENYVVIGVFGAEK